MVFLSPPNSNGLLLSTFQARTNPPLTRALAYNAFTYYAIHAGGLVVGIHCIYMQYGV
jgi:hypothetical protein